MNYAAFRQWYWANRPGDIFDVNSLTREEIYPLLLAADYFAQHGYNVTWCYMLLHNRLNKLTEIGQ